ncbi:MAG: DUF1273 domain-containing protein [Clostridia bacterium]|nr:DUF1273 domain-containing protein [Clostridia bacterium]
MEIEKTAMFIGHSKIYTDISNTITPLLTTLIENGVDTFLNGGMGDFDNRCAYYIKLMKEKYPHIKHYMVLPYPNYKVYRDFMNFDRNIFDDSIYPDLEECYFKAIIPKRNEWMIKNSKYAVCYVNHDWGGAAKTYKKAVKRGLITINIAEGI